MECAGSVLTTKTAMRSLMTLNSNKRHHKLPKRYRKKEMKMRLSVDALELSCLTAMLLILLTVQMLILTMEVAVKTKVKAVNVSAKLWMDLRDQTDNALQIKECRLSNPTTD